MFSKLLKLKNWRYRFAGDIRKEIQLKEKLRAYEAEHMVPPGHFYSPLVNTVEIRKQEEIIFQCDRKLNAIDMQEKEQWKLVEQFKNYYLLLGFPEEPLAEKRYFYNNGFFIF